MTASPWTPDIEARAIKLFTRGCSGTEIALTLATPDWLPSRNAVIGRLHRLGVVRGHRATGTSCRPKTPVARRAPQPKAKAGGVPVPAQQGGGAPPSERAAPPRYIAATAAVRLTALQAGACRFPVGNDTGADQLFCACQRAPGAASYCADHLRIAVTRRLAMG